MDQVIWLRYADDAWRIEIDWPASLERNFMSQLEEGHFAGSILHIDRQKAPGRRYQSLDDNTRDVWILALRKLLMERIMKFDRVSTKVWLSQLFKCF
jgi:hypothetical protein